jgi:pyruvate-formate lyase
MEVFGKSRSFSSGYMEEARDLGVELVPTRMVYLIPAGPTEQAAFEHFRDTMVADMAAAHREKPLDGIILFLHGAGLADGYPDLEGELLRALRAEFGPDLPISAALDLHGNISEEMMAYAIRMLEAERIGNDAMRICAFIDDCIERGRSIYSGGERYTFISPIFVGFATALDSINAIKELVFDKKKISLDEFCRVVENNFENDEPLRQYIINKVAHYGNDSSEIDAMAAELAHGLVRATRSDDVLGGKIMCPGTFSYINHATMGERTGATFDGRLRGTSYSDGCCPVQGRDTKGPTAMILSLTSFDESELLGGMVVNMKFAKNNLSGERADSFVSILRTFMERGGIEMQVNVVDKATLIEAKREPEKHSDLIVRIGGFSDYFVRLRPSLQDEIIERTEY